MAVTVVVRVEVAAVVGLLQRYGASLVVILSLVEGGPPTVRWPTRHGSGSKVAEADN